MALFFIFKRYNVKVRFPMKGLLFCIPELFLARH